MARQASTNHEVILGPLRVPIKERGIDESRLAVVMAMDRRTEEICVVAMHPKDQSPKC